MGDLRHVDQLGDGPLCPMDDGTSRAHRAVVQVKDAFAEQFPTDDDGEMAPEHDRMCVAALNKIRDRMGLYQITASTSEARGYVEAWFFKCPVCGFVLPAQFRQRATP